MRHRFTAGLLTLTVGAGLMGFGAPTAHASSKGRKNTAIGLGALAAYGLLSGKTGTGLLAGAGAAYAYKRYRKLRKGERRSYRYYGGNRSSYRLNSAGGGLQLPAGYGAIGGRFQEGGLQCPPRVRERSYAGGSSRPFVTDEMGNRRYYDPREGDGYHRHDGRPYGWDGFVSRYEVDTQSNPYTGDRSQDCPPGQYRSLRHSGRRR